MDEKCVGGMDVVVYVKMEDKESGRYYKNQRRFFTYLSIHPLVYGCMVDGLEVVGVYVDGVEVERKKAKWMQGKD